MTRPTHRAPWSGMISDAADAHVGLFGIPFDSAVSFRKGAALAPQRIRSITPYIAPFTEDGLSLAGLKVRDYGDAVDDLNWERYFDSVRQEALKVLQHPLALFLGGDHSVTIPLIQAFDESRTSNFGIVHIDSHTDLMDTYDGHRWSHACTQRRSLEAKHLLPQHLSFIGIRSWLQDEIDILKVHPEIKVQNARTVARQGIAATAENVIQQLHGVESIYLTLDIDCLDPAHAPGTGTPEAGGMTTRDVLELLRLLFAALPIHAMDIVEVSPPLDVGDITSMAAIKIMYEVLGFRFLLR